MTLHFQVLDGGDGSFGWTGASTEAVLERFDTLLDNHHSGTMARKTYLDQLQLIIEQAPDFVDAYAHLAMAYLDDGKPKKALECALQGLGTAHQLIPEGFIGEILWGHLSNRPYLRAQHTAVLAYVRLRKHKEAVELIDRMLVLNPNDNQGVRYLLGSEALSAKDTNKAKSVFTRYADEYPPYWYELAWLHMSQGNWIHAATALRRGFAANPYIAEMIAGYTDPIPLALWHGSNLEDHTGAHDYFSSYGARWTQRIDSMYFTRWLFNHSKILVERAELLNLKEQLKWEQDFSKRGALVGQETQVISKIDNTMSQLIVKQHTNREGKASYPWMEMLLNP